ncbi:MAG TPA: DUF2281 domain-containing protein [Gemmatimonadales bacterium]|nr:DUF2281 domain-containing protein [Gemmatimonadales bacterium]
MNEFLRKRIERKLEELPDERVYQVLDYIEFLESRYGQRTVPAPSPFQKLAETVEDALRAGKVSASAIRGTMDVMSTAGRLMSGLAAAGKAVVDQVAGSGDKAPGREVPSPQAPASSEPPPPGSAESA